MPNWHAPESTDLQEAIGEALSDLDLSGDPAFEEVIGMSFGDITRHATRAVVMLIGSNSLKPDDPSTIIQTYVLGFVVGCKYGEHRST